VPDFLVGLDLGQVSDPTALMVLKRSMAFTAAGLPRRNRQGGLTYAYEARHIARYRGVPYPEIVRKVSTLIRHPALGRMPRLAIDATGVGRPVVDMFLDEDMPCEVYPITITAGDEARRDGWNHTNVRAYWVPKNELVSAVQALLQSGRLKVARIPPPPETPNAEPLDETFRKELLDFRAKITAAANKTFEARTGKNDDLVLAGAMAGWLGEQRGVHYHVDVQPEVGPPTLEAASLRAEAKLEAEALGREEAIEATKREEEWRNPFAAHWWPDSQFD
jgi:hypothetical protein